MHSSASQSKNISYTDIRRKPKGERMSGKISQAAHPGEILGRFVDEGFIKGSKLRLEACHGGTSKVAFNGSSTFLMWSCTVTSTV